MECRGYILAVDSQASGDMGHKTRIQRDSMFLNVVLVIAIHQTLGDSFWS